jgi:DNA-binding LacI/PurR family transcriptional regulator
LRTEQPDTPVIPKYRRIYEDLLAAIRSEALRPGERLPSEAALGREYNTSRITVAKALRELQQNGLVSRRAGSGTHVLAPARSTGYVFGLLIPDLGRTEIFEPICHGMMQSPLSRAHSLLWGHASSSGGSEGHEQEQEAEQTCMQFIAQKVSGVFFAPIEFTPNRDVVNRRIIAALERAGVAIVLLDRCYAPYPQRSRYDLVGVDNRSAAYMITEHMLGHLRTPDSGRLAFVARRNSAATVNARVAGYREAMHAYSACQGEDLVRFGDVRDEAFISELLESCRPEAILCANDVTAARLMTMLTRRGVRVPEEMRIAGFDDVKYADLLPVPLTTQHQNCAQIGSTAMATMLDRLARPNLPTRDVLLQTHTVVRQSCGSHVTKGKPPDEAALPSRHGAQRA